MLLIPGRSSFHIRVGCWAIARDSESGQAGASWGRHVPNRTNAPSAAMVETATGPWSMPPQQHGLIGGGIYHLDRVLGIYGSSPAIIPPVFEGHTGLPSCLPCALFGNIVSAHEAALFNVDGNLNLNYRPGSI